MPVDIPVLGILENMSVHECSNCGHIGHVFGADGGQRVADDLSVPLLGKLPLAMSIREQADGGQPTVKVEPDSQISGLYRDAARNMAAQLWSVKPPLLQRHRLFAWSMTEAWQTRTPINDPQHRKR